MGDREYIDGKFDKLVVNIRWGIGSVITIMLVLSTVVGANSLRGVKNRAAIEVNSANIVLHSVILSETVTKKQMERLIQFSALKKEIVMMVLEGRTDEINSLWEELQKLEQTVINDDYGFYGNVESYKERVMSNNK